ncbi:MAG: glycine zipper domain-containing protein [Actinomycetota bacterium]
MNKKVVCAALAITLTTTSCATTGGPSNNQIGGTAGGALIGGLAGRLIGGNNTGMIIGALAGAAIGAAFGTWLDDREQQQMTQATAAAAETLPTGERIAWSAPTPPPPDTAPPPPAAAPVERVTQAPLPPPPGAKTAAKPTTPAQPPSATGWIIPTSDPYRTADGRTCRDLKQVATKNGDTREQSVTACKSGAGGWEIPT